MSITTFFARTTFLWSILMLATNVNAQVVTFYKDANYQGDNMSYSAEYNECCMCLTKREGSWLGSQFQCPGRPVRDDEISSIKIAPGWKVICYWDPWFAGASIEFAGDVPYVGDYWNDRTSSFKIVRVLPQRSAPVAPPSRGVISFGNDNNSDVYLYIIQTFPGKIAELQCNATLYASIAPNATVTVHFAPNSILSYYVFDNATPCERRYLIIDGSIAYNNAAGGKINIPQKSY